MRRFPCPDGAMRLAATGLGCALIMGSMLAANAQRLVDAKSPEAAVWREKAARGPAVVQQGDIRSKVSP